MAIIGLDHIQLAMPQAGEDKARAFFADILGLEEVPRPEALRANGGCWFEGGSAQIHLGVETPFTPARKAHPALLVDDLNALITELSEAGINFTHGKPIAGYRRGDINDPFGNRIELIQKL